MEHKVFVADNLSDYQQLLRHVGEVGLKLPAWRQQRPSLLAEAATIMPSGDGGSSTMLVRCSSLYLKLPLSLKTELKVIMRSISENLSPRRYEWPSLPFSHPGTRSDTFLPVNSLSRKTGSQTIPHRLYEIAGLRFRPKVLGPCEAMRYGVPCRGFVRGLGLSANQALHIPGAGDFQIDSISTAPRPEPAVGQAQHPGRGLPLGVSSMDAEDSCTQQTLAVADADKRESLARVNEPDPLEGEQTWPTEEVAAVANTCQPMTLWQCSAGRCRRPACSPLALPVHTMHFAGRLRKHDWKSLHRGMQG